MADDDGPPPLEDIPTSATTGKRLPHGPGVLEGYDSDDGGDGPVLGGSTAVTGLSAGALGGAGGGSGGVSSSGSGGGSGSSAGVAGGEDETLMEAMMAAAAEAKKAKERERAKQVAVETKSFGKGLSGGFFSKSDQSGSSASASASASAPASSAPSASTSASGSASATSSGRGRTSAPASATSSAVGKRQCQMCGKSAEAVMKAEKRSLLRCGKCKVVWYCSQACQRSHWKVHKKECGKEPEIIHLKAPTDGSGAADPAASLRLPEVQQAMKATADGMSAKLSDGKWMTPDFMAKFASNPRLLRAMADPRFNAVLQEMQTNPSAALAKCKDDPEMKEVLTDFLQLMGDHFTNLGEKEDKEGKDKKGGKKKKTGK